MQIDRILIEIGSQAFTLLDVMLASAGLALAIMLITLIATWRSQGALRFETRQTLQRASELEYRLAELSGSIKNFTDQTQGAQAHFTRTLDERLDLVGKRVGHGLMEQSERTTQSLTSLGERLAVIDAAQKNLAMLSSEMISFKDILANKQTRGAYGQGRMEAIIADGLHSKAYAFQPTLSNGMRPDCLISLPDSELRLVVDAKFPLEAFNALREARGDVEIRAAEQRLRGDVSKHVKDIAEKYLIPGETHETAIMFVPSESTYADLHEKFEEVIQRAYRSRVIIASPNVLMLLIQTMQAIIKDSAMREQAGLIRAEVAKLLEDTGRLAERVGDLQKHFSAAHVDLEKLGISADKISKRAVRIESLELEEPVKPAIAATKMAGGIS